MVDYRTLATAATVESQPFGDVEVGTLVTYTMQTRSDNGDAQAVDDDVFTVTFSCDTEERRSVVADVDATVTSDATGLYTATATLDGWCTYDVLISMTN